MKYEYLIILVLLLFSLGCVTDYRINKQVNEQISTSNVFDFDYDGFSDYKSILYYPVKLTHDGYFISQRTIISSEYTNNIEIISLNNLTDDDADKLQTLIYEYDNDFKNKGCSSLGVEGLKQSLCTSPESCFSLCGDCSQFSNEPQLVGYWVYNYSETKREMRSLLDDLETNIMLVKSMSPEARKTLMKKINRLIDLSVRIESNPLFSANAFGICDHQNYQNNKLIEMLDILGNYKRTPSSYIYTIYINIASTKDSYNEISLKDSIPKPLPISIIEFVKTEDVYKFDQHNATVSTSSLSLGSKNQVIVSYSFISNQPMREDIIWKSPKVEIGALAVSNLLFIKIILGITNKVYSYVYNLGYFPALAIVLLFWVYLGSLVITIFKILIGLFEGIVYRRNLKGSLEKSFGKDRINVPTYLIVSLLFIAIGFILCNVLSLPSVEKNLILTPNYILQKISTNILPFIGFILIFIGGYMVYGLFEELIKIILFGTIHKAKSEKMSVSLMLDKLEKEMIKLKKLIKQNKDKLDMSEEESLIKAAPLSLIRSLLKAGNNKKALDIGLKHLEKLENAEQNIKEKLEIINSWDDYERQISLNLEEKEELPIDALIFIPSKWRVWVVNRYIAKHPEMSLVLEDKTIKRKVLSKEERENLLYTRLDSERLGNYTVLENNKIVKTNTPKAALGGVLAYRLVNYAEAFKNKGKLNKIIIKGDKKSIIIINFYSKLIILSFKTKNLDEILKTIKNTLG